MFDGLLASGAFWPTYQVANPTTTPADVRVLRAAIAQMPEHPASVVRMLEGQPTLNGQVKTDDPNRDIWISREGPNYQSGNLWRIVGTLIHENEHAKGANEINARRSQLHFHQSTIAPDASKDDRKFLEALARRFKGYEALARTGLLNRLGAGKGGS